MPGRRMHGQSLAPGSTDAVPLSHFLPHSADPLSELWEWDLAKGTEPAPCHRRAEQPVQVSLPTLTEAPGKYQMNPWRPEWPLRWSVFGYVPTRCGAQRTLCSRGIVSTGQTAYCHKRGDQIPLLLPSPSVHGNHVVCENLHKLPSDLWKKIQNPVWKSTAGWQVALIPEISREQQIKD